MVEFGFDVKRGVQMRKRSFVDLKRLAVLLMTVIMLTTVVGCKSSTVGQEPVDDDVQVEDAVDNPIQDTEEEVQDELTDVDKEVLGLFEFVNKKIPELLAQCEAGDFGEGEFDSDKTPQGYYNRYIVFTFGEYRPNRIVSVTIAGYTIYDMSEAGKKEFFELMREFDGQIYDKLLNDHQYHFAEVHAWLPYAEEMFQLTDTEFDQTVLDEITKKWLDEPEEPDYKNYYHDFYEKLIVPNL